MKRLFVLVSCAVLLGGCALTFPKPPAPARPVAKVAAPILRDVNGREIERVVFRPGVSSVTVEHLAKEQGCTGGQGAGLTSAPGPVETYRMVCASNMVFLAKCEFRQCKPMSAPPEGGYAARAPAPMPARAPQAASAVSTSPVSAPVVAAAPAVVIPAAAGREAPKLVIGWDCGACVANEKIAAVITAAYEKEAAARGYAVSGTQSATMSIKKYRERATTGTEPGRDLINTQTAFGNKTVKVTDASSNILFTMSNLGESVGKATFEKLFPSRK